MSAKVLLIDDDQDFRVSMRSLLQTRGYEIEESPDERFPSGRRHD